MDARETGKGVRTSATLQNLSQGILMPTDNPMDIAIDGDGMMEVTLPDGQVAYAHGGSLRMDGIGGWSPRTGRWSRRRSRCRRGSPRWRSKSDGTVIARSLEGDLQTIGKLKLVRFENPEGLQMIGENALLPTVASGAADRGAGRRRRDRHGGDRASSSLRTSTRARSTCESSRRSGRTS